MDQDHVQRPRWGTFSVIDHQRPAGLIPEILLYDRLVFPVPTDDADRKRWVDRGWEPALLDTRLKELDGLVHVTPWTPELREKWSSRWEHLKRLGQDTETVAMGLTPMVLAMSAFADQVPPPIMIAAYQDPVQAEADLALREGTEHAAEPQAKARQVLDQEVRALFERRLDMPTVMRPHQAYDKAITLAHDPKYQQARRSLFTWEDKVVDAGWPTAAALKELERLVDAHDDFIKSTFEQTVKRSIFSRSGTHHRTHCDPCNRKPMDRVSRRGRCETGGCPVTGNHRGPGRSACATRRGASQSNQRDFHEVMFPEV